MADTDKQVDELYGLPLDEFTAARDALVKDLRKQKERERADEVKALRKPSAAAWLVNQLARTQSSEAKELLASADKLRKSQERLLAGKGKGGELAEAAERQNAAVRALMARAAGLLDRDGHSPSSSTLEKAEETLRAVALDDDAREEFAAGRFTRERRASGLGLLGSGGAVAAPPARPAKKTKKDDKPQRAEQRARAREALKEAKEQHRARKRGLSDAERAVRDAERDVERAQRRRADASTALDEAEAAEAEAQQRVAEAEAAAKRA